MNSNLRSSFARELLGAGFLRRHRGEKKAIPEEQKDGKYFERRKRNNEAAKRSRDARKLREDRVRICPMCKIILLSTVFHLRPQIAFRATILEQENTILKSQIYSLRDEIATLRQMIFPRAPPPSL